MADNTNEFEQEKPQSLGNKGLDDLLKTSQEHVNVCPAGAQCGDVIKGEYLVLFKPEYKAEDVWSKHKSLSQKMIHSAVDGEDVAQVPTIRRYDALNGIACQLTDKEYQELLKDKKHVKAVEPNSIYTIPKGEMESLADPSPDQDPTKALVIPKGLFRMQATESKTAHIGQPGAPVDADVYVIDTGCDLKQKDVNLVENKTFVFGTFSGNDGNGHGTWCTSRIGAQGHTDEDGVKRGVYGVAPGARMHAFKVLNDQGSGSMADIAAAINELKERAEQAKRDHEKDPEQPQKTFIASMSLGGKGDSKIMNDAMSQASESGVTFCVAAGNSHEASNQYSPAKVKEAITVDCYADADGKGGGKGEITCRKGETDDKFASFSNFGPKNTETNQGDEIAANGVCELSAWLNGQYKAISGTSMSTPAVAGTAALYVSKHKEANWLEVKNAILSNAISPDNKEAWAKWGITGDPDPKQRVLDVSSF